MGESDREERPATDLRRLRARSERLMLLAVILLLLVVGGGLIGLIFGWREMLGALPCLIAAVVLIGGLYVLLILVERWVNNR